jgi:outer membrane immunogenic protein
MKKILLATAAAIAFIAPAQAADMPVKARPPVAVVDVYNWSGFYIGVHGGGQWSRVNVQNPAFPPGFDFRKDSAVFGGQIGVQYQFGRIVLGVESDWTFSGHRNSDSVTCFAPGPQLTPGGTGLCNTRIKDIWTVGPRVGYAADRFMPYVTGGWASTKYNFEGRSNAGTLNEVAQTRLNGWFIGGGIDMVIYQNLVLGVEYRHVDFRTKTVRATNPAGVFLENARFDDARSDSITARLSYRFNPWSAVVARY